MRNHIKCSSVIKGLVFWTLLTCLLPFFSYGQTCSYRVLPLGDSITLGVGSSDLSSYRKSLASMLDINTNYSFDFVGSLNAGPETFDNDHEGHGGWTASQLAVNIFSWLRNNPAEIVLLHAGTNSLTISPSGVEAILNEIDRFSPDTWVILALIINQDPYNATVTIFNNNLLAMAQNRINNGDKIIIVDQEGALIYPDDLADPLHPNDEGYSKMAQVWETALEPLANDLCNGPPHIIASAVAPKTLGIVTVPYTYQVRAYGNPAILYELTSAPGGMTINPATGLISWTPTATGSFNVTVRVSNSFGSDTQSFVIDVRNPATTELVIDDGQPGTIPVGKWIESTGPNPYGGRSLYSTTRSDNYTFEAARSGLQEVYLWWTTYSNRNTNVPIQIYDGAASSTVYVNQRLNGGQWNYLGTYNFSGVARVQIISTESTLTTCADAVRFVPIGSSAPTITSDPITTGSVGLPYTYDVQAYGSPTLLYELTSAPGGMTINPATGLISWTPTATGSFNVTVRVSNSFGSDTQSFVIDVEITTVRYTTVAIQNEQFYINDHLTYEGRTWNGNIIEGLLFNARLVNGIFDDLNPQTVNLWKYPDTGIWDPNRNTSEFVNAMQEWRNQGMLAFSLNIQGGSPTGYGSGNWLNPGYFADGNLRTDYMDRLESIINKADELGMVVILGLFYFGQDEYLTNEASVKNALSNVINWLMDKGYRNVIIEINNECDHGRYDHTILTAPRIHELIELAKSIEKDGFRFLVGTSFNGGSIPTNNVVKSSDFILIHGNGVDHPAMITEMIRLTRNLTEYRPMPILINEDDHYGFDDAENNLVAAIQSYASWGYFDYRRAGEPFQEGFQSLPVDWSISSTRKMNFFEKLSEITGLESFPR
ncbi:MAG: Xanthan lyase precursor [Syntrophorhabdus sp. PtaB.Bin027]|nr:MAG: Xanthan lyase precursor [Syntrophorhabdus sp. PtaB.Bin027]OQB75554.1 MAG: Xanthan lyase precursor [Deltaproteobacteria bacterium ADurb.Bin135]